MSYGSADWAALNNFMQSVVPFDIATCMYDMGIDSRPQDAACLDAVLQARLDVDNEPQPDVCLLIDPARGGKAKIDEDGYIEGAPEFVAEVTASTVSIDLGPKLNAYRRNGVGEYLVWRVQDSAIDWFILHEGRFDRHLPDADGITRSVVFHGMWLDSAALLVGDLARVHAVLRDGLTHPTHAAFTAKLATAQASR